LDVYCKVSVFKRKQNNLKPRDERLESSRVYKKEF